jgi:hypothetical protein
MLGVLQKGCSVKILKLSIFESIYVYMHLIILMKKQKVLAF